MCPALIITDDYDNYSRSSGSSGDDDDSAGSRHGDDDDDTSGDDDSGGSRHGDDDTSGDDDSGGSRRCDDDDDTSGLFTVKPQVSKQHRLYVMCLTFRGIIANVSLDSFNGKQCL